MFDLQFRELLVELAVMRPHRALALPAMQVSCRLRYCWDAIAILLTRCSSGLGRLTKTRRAATSRSRSFGVGHIWTCGGCQVVRGARCRNLTLKMRILK